jgi:predicted histone-like DNA-binding protein
MPYLCGNERLLFQIIYKDTKKRGREQGWEQEKKDFYTLLIYKKNIRVDMNYTFRELPDMQNTGERKVYPKVDYCGQMTNEEFLHMMEKVTMLQGGTIQAVIAGMAKTIGLAFLRGDSVKIDGLGIFSVKLGMKKESETEVLKQRGERYNTTDVEIKGVNFLTDQQWLKSLRHDIELNKSRGIKTIRKIESTEEERFQKAMQYLENQPFITVSDYVGLTGLGQTKAKMELRQFADNPDCGISRKGNGSHVVYIKKQG